MNEQQRKRELRSWILSRLDNDEIEFSDEQLIEAVHKFGFNYKALAEQLSAKASVVGGYLLLNWRKFGLDEFFRPPDKLATMPWRQRSMDAGQRSEDLFRTISAPDRLIEQLEAFKEATAAMHYPDIGAGTSHRSDANQGVHRYGTVPEILPQRAITSSLVPLSYVLGGQRSQITSFDDSQLFSTLSETQPRDQLSFGDMDPNPSRPMTAIPFISHHPIVTSGTELESSLQMDVPEASNSVRPSVPAGDQNPESMQSYLDWPSILNIQKRKHKDD